MLCVDDRKETRQRKGEADKLGQPRRFLGFVGALNEVPVWCVVWRM